MQYLRTHSLMETIYNKQIKNNRRPLKEARKKKAKLFRESRHQTIPRQHTGRIFAPIKATVFSPNWRALTC